MPAGTAVHTILQTSDGTTWIGADALHRIEGDVLVPEPVPHGFPLWGGIRALHEDRSHNLWVATGFIIWHREGGAWLVLGNGEAGLERPVENPARAFAEGADGTLWIGHSRGLARVGRTHVQSFGAAEGLLSDPITGIVNTGRNGLWLATAMGILRVDEAALDAVADGRATTVVPRRFGVDDGMRTARCEGDGASGTVLQDPAGRLWFSTGRGLTILDPEHLAPPSPPPHALIERVLVDGVAVALAASPSGTGPRSLRIPPGAHSIRFEYTAVAFRAAEELRFHHRLDPLDAHWSEPEQDRSVLYARVPGGQYTFTVAAASADGQWGPATTALTVMVEPRLPETWWFRILLVMLGIAMLAAAHGARTSRLRARHAAVLAERMRIAREIHDTLAQGYTGISLELEAATRRLQLAGGDPRAGQISGNLDKARLLVRMSLADARRAVLDLRDPASDTDLGQALKAHAARVQGDVPIDVTVSGNVRRLPAGHERALLRIAGEATTNALRHARASRIAVALTFASDEVELRISDDGVGLTGEATEGFGLIGMNERARELEGSVAIHSQPGEGTQIIARIPTGSPQPGT
jgi:signal transduction histidine kinase